MSIWTLEATNHTITDENETTSRVDEWHGDTLVLETSRKMLGKKAIAEAYQHYKQAVEAEECWIDDESLNFIRYDENGDKHEYEVLVRPPDGVSQEQAMDAFASALAGRIDDLR